MIEWSKVYHRHKAFDIDKVLKHVRSLGGKKTGGAANDGLLYNAMLRKNQIPISTVANCAKYIGEIGAHGTKEFFDNRGFADMPFYQFPVSYTSPNNEFFENSLDHLKEAYGFNIYHGETRSPLVLPEELHLLYWDPAASSLRPTSTSSLNR